MLRGVSHAAVFAKTDEAATDVKKLKRILKTDLAVICRRQKCC
jgi:hypothetical protein